jgi:hypothetical protein
MRVVRVAIGCLVALLAVPSRFSAQEPAPKPTPSTFKETVAICAAWVRQKTNAEMGCDECSGFDAYVTSVGGNFRFFGTDTESSQFEKCMDKFGHSLAVDR